MVPKRVIVVEDMSVCFRAVLFRMVPKRAHLRVLARLRFRAVLFRMVPKLVEKPNFRT